MPKVTHIMKRAGHHMAAISIIVVTVASTLLLGWMFRAASVTRPAVAEPTPPRLVYTQRITSGAEIVSVARDGTGRQIVDSVAHPANPDLRLDRLDEVLPSPDGRWLAFNQYECTRGEATECRASAWAKRLDGTAAWKIEADHDYYEVVQWFPGSPRLLLRDRPLSVALVYNVETGEVRQLDIPEPAYSFGRGSLSPDGSKLIYSAYTGEWIYHLDGSRRTRLDLPRTRFNIFNMSWSPQGDRIAIVPIDRLNSLSAGELWVVEGDGTNAHRLSAPDALAWAPLWSPTGNTIYFVQANPETLNVWHGRPELATGNLWAVQVETRDLRPLTTFQGRKIQSPALSPEGGMIAFIGDVGGFDEIWTVDLESSELQQVTNDGRQKTSGLFGISPGRDHI